jgi:uncharacterized cupin superfamily protein
VLFRSGHHFVNESGEDCVFVAIGRKAEGLCLYPDIDMMVEPAKGGYTHKDGTPY